MCRDLNELRFTVLVPLKQDVVKVLYIKTISNCASRLFLYFFYSSFMVEPNLYSQLKTKLLHSLCGYSNMTTLTSPTCDALCHGIVMREGSPLYIIVIRTGPAVRPVKDQTRAPSGLVHLKDCLCNRTGKNRSNWPFFWKTIEPGSLLRTGMVLLDTVPHVAERKSHLHPHMVGPASPLSLRSCCTFLVLLLFSLCSRTAGTASAGS